jgi:hypothetical protein
MTTTTIENFPSLRDYTRRTSISRNGTRINITDFIYEWKREDDQYDYFSSRESDGYYALNYKIFTYLLLNHQQLFLNHFTKDEFLKFVNNGNMFYEQSSYIKGLEEYMEKNKIDVNAFILEQFKNIQILSNSLMSPTKLPTLYAIAGNPRYSRYGKNKEKLVLFRGFNYVGCKKMLHNLHIGKVITTETFLSTSIQELVAIKYAFNYDKDVDKHIVWKIIIDGDMFDIFNYTFISERFNIYDNLETLLANQNIECEFLLNMGALLKCIDINVIYDFQGYSMTGYNIPAKAYTEYTFKFLGWNLDYIQRINRNMSKYIEYLK